MSWVELQIDRLMRGQPAGFREVLTEALRDPDKLPAAIETLEEVMLESDADGQLTVEVLKHLPLTTFDAEISPLQTVMMWLQDAEAPAARALMSLAGPQLIRIYDALYDRLGALEEDSLSIMLDLMAVLRVLVTFTVPGTIERMVTAADHPLVQEAHLWPSVFEVLEAPEHPWRLDILDPFNERWPGGFAQAAFLEFANRLALDGELAHHPFDSPRGHAALRAWLTEPEDELSGYASAAAAALPFVDERLRLELLKYADRHPDTSVRIEAASARASEGEGDPAAVDRLREWARDPRYAEVAIAHLEEVGAAESIPPVVRDPDFRAAASMASWLAQPTEFNRPPDELVAIDTRRLHWPPTDDRRQVWLFRYRYWPVAADETIFEGLGMVGSVTFAMADEDTESLSVPEAYGLHCAWELEMMDDARAPPFRDPRAGLRILRALNPDL